MVSKVNNYYSLDVTNKQFKFSIPSQIAFIGPTSSGKSTLVINLLLQADKYFERPFSHVIFVYGYYQPLYDKLKNHFKEKITFKLGYSPNVFENIEDISSPCLFVFDDVESAVLSCPHFKAWSTGGFHHTNSSLSFCNFKLNKVFLIFYYHL